MLQAAGACSYGRPAQRISRGRASSCAGRGRAWRSPDEGRGSGPQLCPAVPGDSVVMLLSKHHLLAASMLRPACGSGTGQHSRWVKRLCSAARQGRVRCFIAGLRRSEPCSSLAQLISNLAAAQRTEAACKSFRTAAVNCCALVDYMRICCIIFMHSICRRWRAAPAGWPGRRNTISATGSASSTAPRRWCRWAASRTASASSAACSST